MAVPTLLPPQLPSFFTRSYSSYTYSPPNPGQGPPRLAWLPFQQQQRDQLQEVRQQIRNKPGTGGSTRRIPTASGNTSSSSSYRHISRSPVDIAFRAIGGAGIGAGAGGLVSLTHYCCRSAASCMPAILCSTCRQCLPCPASLSSLCDAMQFLETPPPPILLLWEYKYDRDRECVCGCCCGCGCVNSL